MWKNSHTEFNKRIVYTLKYSTFRNNQMCFNFETSFNRNKKTFAATRHVPCALNTTKIRLQPGLAATHILVYLDPMKGVWWLQTSFSRAW